MNNAGYPFDWRAIEGLKEKYPALDNLIGSVDEDFITLGKEEEPDLPPPDENDLGVAQDRPAPMPEPVSSEPAPVDVGNGRNPERATVDKMAARAARF